MRKLQKLRRAHADLVMNKFAIPTRRRYITSDASVISYAEVAKLPSVKSGTAIQNADGTFISMSGYDW